MKRIVFLLIGIIISVVALYLAFQDFHFGEMGEAMARMRWPFFLLMIGPYIATFMTKVWRWRTMFHPDERRVPFGLLFASLMISYIPLPFRAGEVARGMLTSARSGLPPARVFSTILVEKVLDVLALLVLLGVSLPFVGLPDDIRGSAMVVGVVVLTAALVLLVLVLRPRLARWLTHSVAARLPTRFGRRIEEATEHVLEGLAPLSNPRIALRLGAWSLATWSVNSLTVYLMLLTFNIELALLAAVVLVVASNLSMVVPAAPGYVGTFEGAVIAVLLIFGVARPDAQTFALMYHFLGLAPVATMGVIAAIQQGLGMSAFRGSPEEVAIPAEEAAPGLRAATGRDERC